MTKKEIAKHKKGIKEMRHEIIEYAINIEYWLDEEITSYFGFDSWEASYHNQLERERETFKDCFLKVSLSKKFEYIIRIMKDMGEKPYSGFIGDTERFRKIRNMFAHESYPLIEPEFSSSLTREITKLNQRNWKKMYEEAKILFEKITKEIDDKFYTKEPRMRKYRSWALLEKLGIIRKYEGALKSERKKKKSNSV
jgi:hypothetical protein